MFLRQYFNMNKSSEDDNAKKTLNLNISQPFQRSKTSKQISKFEYLPNELIFSIFKYLYCNHIIYAFNQLNCRFQSLLHSYEYCHLNFFHKTMKSKFNLIHRLPIQIEHIQSLTLSNLDYSCTNIDQSLLKYPIELFYTKLQSLSVVKYDIDTDDDCNDDELLSLILLLPNFQQLKYLLINKTYFKVNSDIIKQVRGIILFEIKTLKYFTWDVCSSFFERIDEALPIQKSNIEHYEFRIMSFKDLEWLNLHTINMKSINIHNPSLVGCLHQEQTFETLISIKLDNFVRLNDIQFLFEHLIFLIRLKRLELQGSAFGSENYIDGYKWKQLIQKYTPQLKVFKFLFTFRDLWNSKTINELIEPFMTEFWLTEKKWFITCDEHAQHNVIDIYTVPYMNNKCNYSSLRQRISTATINDTSNIHQFTFSHIKSQDIISNSYFTNVQSLTLCEIAHDVTYDQLNTFLNISSIKHIAFQSQINSKLFFEILKYNLTLISIDIEHNHLTEILRRTTYYQKVSQLKKIKQVTIYKLITKRHVKRYIPLTTKEIENLYYLFPNIEELCIEGSLESIESLSFLLNKFKHLKFLIIHFNLLKPIRKDTIGQQLINQQNTKLNENNFIYKWFGDIFYIWID